MPGSRLNIRFDSHYGDRRASEQVFIIPFREGENVRYFMVRGVSECDRCVTRCNMVRIMDWGDWSSTLGMCGEEMWDVMLFKLKVAEMSMP